VHKESDETLYNSGRGSGGIRLASERAAGEFAVERRGTPWQAANKKPGESRALFNRSSSVQLFQA
jgi:hypothetical protein